jgi:hypothetical protein
MDFTQGLLAYAIAGIIYTCCALPSMMAGAKVSFQGDEELQRRMARLLPYLMAVLVLFSWPALLLCDVAYWVRWVLRWLRLL